MWFRRAFQTRSLSRLRPYWLTGWLATSTLPRASHRDPPCICRSKRTSQPHCRAEGQLWRNTRPTARSIQVLHISLVQSLPYSHTTWKPGRECQNSKNQYFIPLQKHWKTQDWKYGGAWSFIRLMTNEFHRFGSPTLLPYGGHGWLEPNSSEKSLLRDMIFLKFEAPCPPDASPVFERCRIITDHVRLAFSLKALRTDFASSKTNIKTGVCSASRSHAQVNLNHSMMPCKNLPTCCEVRPSEAISTAKVVVWQTKITPSSKT